MSQRSAHKHSMSGYNMSGWHGTHTAKMVSVVLTNQKCEISGRIVFKLDFDAELFWASLWTCFGLCLIKTSRKHSFIQVLPRENNYWSHIPQSKRTSYSNRPRQSCHTPCRGPPFSAFLRSPSIGCMYRSSCLFGDPSAMSRSVGPFEWMIAIIAMPHWGAESPIIINQIINQQGVLKTAHKEWPENLRSVGILRLDSWPYFDPNMAHRFISKSLRPFGVPTIT